MSDDGREDAASAGTETLPAMAFRPEWLAKVEEPPLEPGRPIIDPHFHFFDESEVFPHYRLEDLRADTAAHGIRQAVFIQCEEHLRTRGPERLRPVGETEWVDGLAQTTMKAAAKDGRGGVRIAGIVAEARLVQGKAVRETLEAHAEASPLFRGIRDMGLWDADPKIPSAEGTTGPDLYGEPAFREGFRELASMGLCFDAHQYHTQLFSVVALARAFPDATIVLDHLGSPLAEGRYAGRREETFAEWRTAMAEVAGCENVVCKLGGLAMPWNGFGWEKRARPPTSDELVETYRPYYTFAIDHFGPDRCMFESNFPVDRLSVSYTVLWNAFEKLARAYSADEQDAMFRRTAARVYRIDPEA